MLIGYDAIAALKEPKMHEADEHDTGLHKANHTQSAKSSTRMNTNERRKLIAWTNKLTMINSVFWLNNIFNALCLFSIDIF